MLKHLEFYERYLLEDCPILVSLAYDKSIFLSLHLHHKTIFEMITIKIEYQLHKLPKQGANTNILCIPNLQVSPEWFLQVFFQRCTLNILQQTKTLCNNKCEIWM